MSKKEVLLRLREEARAFQQPCDRPPLADFSSFLSRLLPFPAAEDLLALARQAFLALLAHSRRTASRESIQKLAAIAQRHKVLGSFSPQLFMRSLVELADLTMEVNLEEAHRLILRALQFDVPSVTLRAQVLLARKERLSGSFQLCRLTLGRCSQLAEALPSNQKQICLAKTLLQLERGQLYLAENQYLQALKHFQRARLLGQPTAEGRILATVEAMFVEDQQSVPRRQAKSIVERNTIMTSSRPGLRKHRHKGGKSKRLLSKHPSLRESSQFSRERDKLLLELTLRPKLQVLKPSVKKSSYSLVQEKPFWTEQPIPDQTPEQDQQTSFQLLPTVSLYEAVSLSRLVEVPLYYMGTKLGRTLFCEVRVDKVGETTFSVQVGGVKARVEAAGSKERGEQTAGLLVESVGLDSFHELIKLTKQEWELDGDKLACKIAAQFQ